jgi:hypothetical protein
VGSIKCRRGQRQQRTIPARDLVIGPVINRRTNPRIARNRIGAPRVTRPSAMATPSRTPAITSG